MTWIRVETSVGRNPKVHKLASVLGLSADNVLALVIKTWCGVAENAPTGDLSDVEDGLIEDWAVWRGVPGEYARRFREVFVSDGVLDGWRERQGKLVAQAEAERARKSAERARTVPGLSEDRPRKVRGQSVPTKTKTIRSSSSSKEETVSSDCPGTKDGQLSYYRACTVALNTGMSANSTIEGGWIPVVASSQVARVTWCEDGIPLEVAEQVILDRCESYHSTSQNRGPRSLKYFDAAIRETWERGKESEATADVTRALA